MTPRTRSGLGWPAATTVNAVVDYYRATGALRTVEGLRPIDDVTGALIDALAPAAPGGRRGDPQVAPRDRAHAPGRPHRRRGPRPRRGGAQAGRHHRPPRPPRGAAHPRRRRHAVLQGLPRQRSLRQRTAAFPASTCISIDNEVVHGIPGDRPIREGRSCRSTSGRSLTAGTATAPGPSSSARSAGGARARDTTRAGDDGRHRGRRCRQSRRRHLGRGRGHRPPATATASSGSSWATASGPRCTRIPRSRTTGPAPGA